MDKQNQSAIRAIIGLGNPTSKEINQYDDRYKGTRHQMGFNVIDNLLSNSTAFNKKSLEISINGNVGAIDVYHLAPNAPILFKPAFIGHNINSLGGIVKAFLDYYELQPHQILVIVDDLDNVAGSLKWKMSGGSGGHNGMKDLIAHIGDGFPRLKMGIGRPSKDLNITILDYVLTPLDENSQDFQVLNEMIEKATLDLKNRFFNF